MISYPFAYHRPNSLPEARALLAQLPDAKLLAGGQTLIPAMKMRLANPAALIDISSLKKLSFIREDGANLVVGAATKHAEVAQSALVRGAIPALATLAESIGDPAVRHMGTLGGSVANNDPAADYTAACLGLGATITTTRRNVAADDFFAGMFSTVLEGDEIITEISFPRPQRAGYVKFENPASRYAIVGAFVAHFDSSVRVAVTGAAPCVFRALDIEAALARDFAPESVATVAISPDGLNSDIHASAEYRAHLVTVMAARAVRAALGS